MTGSDPGITFRLQATVAETGRLHAWLDEVLAGLPDASGHTIRLCLEEAVMNVVLHGYAGTAPGGIEVSLCREPGTLFACVTDSAPPFDPTAATPTERGTIEAGPLGGRGLILMRRYASVFRYAREGGQNRLTLGFPV